MKTCIPAWMAVLCVLVPSAPALAEGWSGGLELGFSNTSGNSRNATLTTRFDLKYENAVWNHELFGDAYYARSDSERTAERHALGYKPRYLLSERAYAFGSLRYDRDRFSDINHRWTMIGGYGRELIDTERTHLEAELGAGARQTKYYENEDGLSRSEPVLYVGGRFQHAVSDTARFVQTLRVEYGHDNTSSEAVSSLQMRVTDTVSAKLSHTFRHNSHLTGVRGKKLDQITTVNMVYSF